MREIADEVGATFMVDMAHFAGLVAGNVFTGDGDPVPHARHHHHDAQVAARSARRSGAGHRNTRRPSTRAARWCSAVPLSHVMAAKAVALAEARQPAFRSYAQSIADNAHALADGFLKRDATLVTSGTDNHLVLLDVTSFGLTGRQAESALLDAGVVTNHQRGSGRSQRGLVHQRCAVGHRR